MDDGDIYREGACFRPRYNKYFPGYTAYESFDWSNYFIRHNGFKLYIDPAKDNDLYKKDASWKTQKEWNEETVSTSVQVIQTYQIQHKFSY